MNFKAWLLTYVDEDTPLGDLARDIRYDKCLKGWTSRALQEHICSKHHPCDEAQEVLIEAIKKYKKYRFR